MDAIVAVIAPAVIEPILSTGIDVVRSWLRQGAVDRAWRDLRENCSSDAFQEDLKNAVKAEWPESDSALLSDLLRNYLQSHEFASVVQQATLLRFAQRSAYALDPLRREHKELMRLYSGALPDFERSSDKLFDITIQAIDGSLGPIEDYSAALPEILTSAQVAFNEFHLSAIHRNLELLAQPDRLSLDKVDRDVSKFARQVRFRHRNITPPNLGAVKHVPMENIYVKPAFVDVAASGDEPVPYDDFVGRVERTVVLGDPGGGKSTLSAKIALDLAVEVAEGGASLTPILLIMRDFGAWKKANGGSVLDYMVHVASDTYECASSHAIFEYLLLNGRARVIFDGLDELLDTSHRRDMVASVETFANLYPAAQILVTSRLVGYDEAPLDPKLFSVHRLEPLSADGVAEYVVKWFRLDDVLNTLESEKMSTAFIRDSAIVSDLRRNPLLLALLCNIYRGERYIPSNRPDVYEKCAVMLFEKWDRHRNIKVHLSIESQVRPSMMFLAYQIYTNESGESEVPRSWLVKETAKYLIDRGRYSLWDDAELAANEFVDFCTGRAWVFTDVGTTSEGESLFRFTHRTFLEYFTAYHLVRIRETPADLAAELLDRLVAAEWDVVAQLAVQQQDRNIDGAATRFLGLLLERAKSEDTRGRQNLISFAARTLGFVYPSGQVIADITSAVVSLALGEPDAEEGALRRGSYLDPLGELLYSAEENFERAASPLAAELIAGVETETSSGLDLPFHLTDLGIREQYESDRVAEIAAIQLNVLESCDSLLRERARDQHFLAADLLRHERIGVREYVGERGLSSVWWTYDPIVWPPNGHYISFAVSWLGAVVSDRFTLAPGILASLSELCDLVLDAKPPFFDATSGQSELTGAGWILDHYKDHARFSDGSVSGLAAVGGLILVCSLVEANGLELASRVVRMAAPEGWLHPYVPLIQTRFSRPADSTEALRRLDAARPGSATVFRDWSRREVDFVSGV